jgi:hypothetical protein
MADSMTRASYKFSNKIHKTMNNKFNCSHVLVPTHILFQAKHYNLLWGGGGVGKAYKNVWHIIPHTSANLSVDEISHCVGC